MPSDNFRRRRYGADLHVREVQSADFNDIIRLYRQLHPRDSIPQDGSVEQSFERILASPGLRLFVLELDGVVVATTYLNVIPNLTRSASPYAVIENVVVEESRPTVSIERAGSRPMQRLLTSPALFRVHNCPSGASVDR
jgi:hypothetical protein